MALTSEATTNLPDDQQPSGWTDPATTITFSGIPISERFQTTIAVAGVAHASNESTGLTQLVSAIKTYVDGTLIPSTYKIDIVGATVNAIITLTNVERNNAEATDTAKLYLTGTESFIVRGIVEYE